MTSPADQPRVYMLTLIGRPGDDPIHGIRALLKLALRRYGLRCVNAREIAPPLQPDRTQAHEIDDRTIASSGRERQANSGRPSNR